MIGKLLFAKSYNYESKATHFGLLVARLFAGLTMAFAHGAGKIPPSEGLITSVGSMGLPLPILFAWAAALSEFVGGLLLALGLLTRPSALFLMVTMATAAFVRHASDPFAKKELALLYLCIYFVIFCLGPGRYSLDHKVIYKM